MRTRQTTLLGPSGVGGWGEPDQAGKKIRARRTCGDYLEAAGEASDLVEFLDEPDQARSRVEQTVRTMALPLAQTVGRRSYRIGRATRAARLE